MLPMAGTAVSRRWLSVCHDLMRRAAIDLAWAVRGYSNYSYAVTGRDSAFVVLVVRCTVSL